MPPSAIEPEISRLQVHRYTDVATTAKGEGQHRENLLIPSVPTDFVYPVDC